MSNSGHFEAKKHAYRQTQDGVVVSFVIHPDEVPADMATAPLGTIYMIGFQSMEEAAKVRAGGAECPRSPIVADGKALDMRAPPASSAKRSASQRAAWLTQQPAFWDFLTKNARGGMPGPIDSASRADARLKIWCAINSKRDLDAPTTHASHITAFEQLEGNFRAWQQAKGHGVVQ